MIGIEPHFNYSGLDRLITIVGSFPQQMKSIVRTAFARRVNLPVLGQLRRTPPRRYWTADDWESAEERRAFLAKTGGKAYVRTGAYAAGWHADIVEDANSITFGYANLVSYASKVGGNDQAKGHIKTGWPNSADVMTTSQPRAVNVFGEAINQYLDEQIGAI